MTAAARHCAAAAAVHDRRLIEKFVSREPAAVPEDAREIQGKPALSEPLFQEQLTYQT
jgi:hypothetical protein